MKYIRLILAAITNILVLTNCSPATRSAQDIPITPRDDKTIKIAFGSCYGKPGKSNNIFETIAKDEPDVWIWLGDATYIDFDKITELISDTGSDTAIHARARFRDT